MTWNQEGQKLVREIRTPDFLSAHALVGRIVPVAEALGHHPDIGFGWGYVRLEVTTHDAGGLTEKDWQLAEAIDRALAPGT